jgi:hypothetical protein
MGLLVLNESIQNILDEIHGQRTVFLQMCKKLLKLQFESVYFFLVAIDLDVIASGDDFQLGKAALYELEFAVGRAKELELVDFRQDDFFFCQTLIHLLITMSDCE